MASYSYGPPLSPAEDRYRQLAALMMARGQNPGITMGGWGGVSQGVGALAQALAGSILSKRADAERQQATDKALSQIDTLGLDPKYAGLIKAIAGTGDVGSALSTAGNILTAPEAETWTTLTPAEEEAAGLDTSGSYERSSRGNLNVLTQPRQSKLLTPEELAQEERLRNLSNQPQPQRLPLDATVYDPNAASGKGGYVYATGPLKGQLAKPGSAAAQPSSVTEAYDRGLAYAKAHKFPDPEGWALSYSKSGSPDYRLPDTGINALPKTSSGEIDEEALEQGLYYDTPQGPAKYLGNGQWELAE